MTALAIVFSPVLKSFFGFRFRFVSLLLVITRSSSCCWLLLLSLVQLSLYLLVGFYIYIFFGENFSR